MEVSQLEILNSGYCQPFNAKTARVLDLDIKIRKESLQLSKAQQRFRLNQLRETGEIAHLDLSTFKSKHTRQLLSEQGDEHQTTVEDFMQDTEEMTNDQQENLRQSIQQQLLIENQAKQTTQSFKIKKPKLKDIKPLQKIKAEDANDQLQQQNLSIYSNEHSNQTNQCSVNKQIECLLQNRNKLSLFRSELQRLRLKRQSQAFHTNKLPITRQKQKVMGKFLEISTMKEASHPRAYSINETINSALITSSFVRSANEDMLPKFKINHSSLDHYFNVQIQNQIFGPSKNLYQFSKTRDQYRDQYLQTQQRMMDIDQRLQGYLPDANHRRPSLHQAYQSLFKPQEDQEQMSEIDLLSKRSSTVTEQLRTPQSKQSTRKQQTEQPLNLNKAQQSIFNNANSKTQKETYQKQGLLQNSKNEALKYYRDLEQFKYKGDISKMFESTRVKIQNSKLINRL